MSELAEVLERFRRGPELLASVLTGLSPEESDWAPGAGKWTIRQILAHLGDGELVGAHRMRLVIAEENPVLTAFDQDAWTRNLNYSQCKPGHSLDTFRRLRAENYELLRGLPEGAFSRTGNHTENGPITLRRLLEGYAGHAESHAQQIQAIRQEYKKARGKQ